jgi:hypothetical protein
VNILSQVVPGLRDARTPFTVGVLWAVAGWLATLLLPASVWQNDAIRGISKQLSAVPAELLIAACLSIIYVLGMFLEILGRVFRRMLFVGAVLGILVLASFFAAIVVKAISFVLPLILAVAMGVALFALARKWRSAPDVSYGDALNDTFSALAGAFGRWFAGWKLDIQQALETDGEILNDLVRTDLRKFLRSHESFLSEALEKLDSGQMYAAASSCGVSVDDVRRLAAPGSAAIPGGVKTIGDLRLHRWRDAAKAPLDVKRILSERLVEDTEYRLAFADAVLDYSKLRVMLRRRMETADITFRKEAPDVYMEYDRIKAEGEFRKGVGIPLAAVLVLAAYKWHLVFNAQNGLSRFWWMCAAAVAAAVFITSAGAERVAKSSGYCTRPLLTRSSL